jgi:hypothetical protein
MLCCRTCRQSGVFVGLMYALVAAGIVLIYKTSGIANLAQGALAMTGAYVTWAFAAGSSVCRCGWPSASLIAVHVRRRRLLERLALRRMIGQPVIMVDHADAGHRDHAARHHAGRFRRRGQAPRHRHPAGAAVPRRHFRQPRDADRRAHRARA